MTWLLIAIILVLLASFLTLFAYFAAFYSSPRRVENPYKLPSGEQYEQGRELMLSLIRELDGIPFEPVTITAFDGVQLCGPLLPRAGRRPRTDRAPRLPRQRPARLLRREQTRARSGYEHPAR